MQIRFLCWLVLCALTTSGGVFAQASGGLKPGSVLVAKVTGEAFLVEASGTRTKLERGLQIPQEATVATLANSSVVLVFSNGATTQLGQQTELKIEQYLQGEFSGEVVPSKITEEPAVSKTRLYLNRGELIGNVKKLKISDGSEFTVRTPVGAAGIRGTTFRITFIPTGTGQAFLTSPWLFQLSTAEGQVTFDSQSRGSGGSGPVNQGQPVNGGVQITVEITVNQLPNGHFQVVGLPQVQSPVDIPANVQVQIAQFAKDMALAAERALFTSGGASSGVVTGTFTPDPPGGGGGGSTDPVRPPPPEPETPRTTPGTG